MTRVNRIDEHNYYLSTQLQEQLSRITRYPLTVIEAPLGYGKTTAVRVFFDKEPVITDWLYVVDGHVDSFWKGFVQLITKMDVACGKVLMDLDFSSDVTTHHKVVEHLRDIKLRQKWICVIDDYHLIENPQVHQLIVLLTRLKIENLHLVLTCRRVPIEELEELELKGEALHLRKEILEFGLEDIKKYFKLENINLEPEVAQSLLGHTEGWVSALYLYRLNYIKEGHLDHIDDLSDIPSIYTLLERTVFAPLDQTEKKLLVQLACFESFTLHQAEFIWGDQSGTELIKRLVSQNAFIAYDSKLKLYRMHNILTNYLFERFDEQSIEEQRRLLLLVAEWYQKSNEPLLAMRYFYSADSFERVLKVFTADRGNSLYPEHKDWLIQVFQECPEDVKFEQPLALLIFGMCFFTFNATREFASLCQVFPSYINDNPHITEKEKRQLMGEYALLLSFTAYNSISGMHLHQKKALELIEGPSRYMNTRGSWTMGSPSVLYMYYKEVGKLSQTVDELKMAMSTYYKLSNNHGSGAEYVMSAEAHYYRGNFIEAEINYHKARQLAKKHHQPEIELCTYFLELKCYIAQGRTAKALENISSLKVESGVKRLNTLSHTVELCEGYIYTLTFHDDQVPKWITKGDFKSENMYREARSLYQVVYSRSLINQKYYTQLLGEVDQFIEEASVFPNVLSLVMLLIYKAVAYEQLFRRQDAMVCIRKAFDIVIADELYMVLVETAPLILRLLDALSVEEDYRWPTSRVKTLCRLQSQREERPVTLSKKEAKLIAPNRKQLTYREIEIAELAAAGMSNKAMAQKLFVSENTIKTTLKNVFEKLDIKSRALLKGKL